MDSATGSVVVTTHVGMDLLWCVPGVGGSEDYLVRQLVGLTSLEHEFDVTVFAPRGFSAGHPDIAASYRIVEAPSRCTSRVVRVILQHTWLPVVARRSSLMHFGGGTVPRNVRVPTVLTLHDIQWVDYPHYVRPIKRAYLRRSVPASIRRATVVAVPSEFVRHTLVTHLHAPGDKIVAVLHGVEPDLASSATVAGELREKYSLGSGPVVVFPATTHPHKNHEFLLRLMANGANEWGDPALRLVITGSAGGAEQSVNDAISRLNLSERVRKLGRVSAADRDGLLRMADALVFPSEYEGFGAPVIEAMAIGAPVICSDRASLPEVVGSAAVVLPLVEADWENALRVVRDRRSELVAAGRERVAHFTAAKSADALLSVYRKALT